MTHNSNRGFIQHHFYKNHKSGAGFTLIELLVVIGILAILASGVFVSYHSFALATDVKTTAFKIVDTATFAHGQTLASLGGSSFGVHFEHTQYVMFKGTVYSALDPANVAYALPSTVEIVNIALSGGGQDVMFDRVTGRTSEAGTLAVRAISDASKTKTVTILSSGQADVSELTLPPSGTRISDTRRVYFTYAQNVQAAGTLTLTFPNGGPLVKNIDFKTYLSGNVFDWSGTVTVNGSPQVLRIHTNRMDASSADFSITRDLRYNTEALQISLDTVNLVNYTASGTVTGGPIFVSNLQAQ